LRDQVALFRCPSRCPSVVSSPREILRTSSCAHRGFEAQEVWIMRTWAGLDILLRHTENETIRMRPKMERQVYLKHIWCQRREDLTKICTRKINSKHKFY
jgi:hypothetical protein